MSTMGPATAFCSNLRQAADSKPSAKSTETRGTGPMLTMLFAVLLLEQRLTTVAMFGVLFIVAGVLVVTGDVSTTLS